MYKIIFLDIDGVLCISRTDDLFDKTCCKNLKEILEETDARIVVSSSWRQSENGMSAIKRNLEENGIGNWYVIGETPDFSSAKKCRTEQEFTEQRWQEITRYIVQHNIRSYVILDDMDFSEQAKESAVKTEMYTGLTEACKNLCISRLKNG
jgi:hypothetical protein